MMPKVIDASGFNPYRAAYGFNGRYSNADVHTMDYGNIVVIGLYSAKYGIWIGWQFHNSPSFDVGSVLRQCVKSREIRFRKFAL
jgi:hypothetical protein